MLVVVHGDPTVLDALEQDVTARYGSEYELVRAATTEAGRAALAMLRAQERQVAVVVAGHRLPDGSGVTLLEALRDLHPEAGRVLLTDHPDAEAAIAAVNQVGLDHYLVRPWHPPEQRLHPVLDRLLGDWRERAGLPYVRVRSVMETDVERIARGASLRQAAELVAGSGVGDLMVVEEDGSFLGVLSEGDILRNALPDIDEILAAGGTLYDGYQLFVRKSRELSDRPILPLVIREPLVMHPDDHVAKAAVVLIDRQIRRLPVVEDGRLVGTVSRADICHALVRVA